MDSKTAEILAVGTELLLGDIVNTNAQYLAVGLAEMGIGVLHQSVVGDNEERLTEAFRLALSRSDIVVTTGGLGPTGDDITREVAAQVLGLPLVLHEESLRRIEAFFEKLGRGMSENNVKQAMLPEGAIVLKNDRGTAPGCVAGRDGKYIVMLPGPPREMRPMFDEAVRPWLAQFSDAVIHSESLRVFGIGEGAVEEKLRDLMQGANPTLAPYAKDGEVLLRVTARAASQEQAKALCMPLMEEIKRRLGDDVYGVNVDSLQQVVVEKLRQKGLKVGLAESCTGGLVAKRLTEIPGCSEVFECGVVSYANHIKQHLLGVHAETLAAHGAVSAETASEMAEGARRTAGASLGVGITGIAGPGGGTPEKPVGLVYVAVSDGETCLVRRLTLGRSNVERDYIRYLAASNALDMVRRFLDGLSQPQDCVSVPVPTPALKTGYGPGAAHKTGFWKRFVRNNIPMKGDAPRQIVFKSLFLLCVAVFIGCLVYLAPYGYDYIHNLIVSKNVSDLYHPTQTTQKNTGGINPSLYDLYKKNPDIRGFIEIPNTHIKYPVMQSKDNNYYLRRDFFKTSNRHGVPFMDYRCSVNPFTQNTIIYGHNMKDDLMFHDLVKYQKASFYNSSPIVTFNTIKSNEKWKIFAAYITNTEKSSGPVFDYLEPGFATAADFENYLAQLRARSMIVTSVDVKPNDDILTLSTCTYEFEDARMVVVARRVRPGESLNVAPATQNPQPLMPDIWYRIFGGQKPMGVVSSVSATASSAGKASKSPSAPSKAAPSPSSGTSSVKGGAGSAPSGKDSGSASHEVSQAAPTTSSDSSASSGDSPGGTGSSSAETTSSDNSQPPDTTTNPTPIESASSADAAAA